MARATEYACGTVRLSGWLRPEVRSARCTSDAVHYPQLKKKKKRARRVRGRLGGSSSHRVCCGEHGVFKVTDENDTGCGKTLENTVTPAIADRSEGLDSVSFRLFLFSIILFFLPLIIFEFFRFFVSFSFFHFFHFFIFFSIFQFFHFFIFFISLSVLILFLFFFSFFLFCFLVFFIFLPWASSPSLKHCLTKNILILRNDSG